MGDRRTTTRGRAALQTQHAIEACDLAAAFNEALKKLSLAPGEYAVELTAPVGPSTAGGLQAMQHLRLVPRLAGYPTLVAGHANHAEGRAELRTYDHLDTVHRQRFRKPLALDRAQYDEFFNAAKQVFTMMHLAVTVVEAEFAVDEKAVASADRPSMRTFAGMPAVMVALLVVLIAVAGAGAWMLGRSP